MTGRLAEPGGVLGVQAVQEAVGFLGELSGFLRGVEGCLADSMGSPVVFEQGQTRLGRLPINVDRLQIGRRLGR